MVTDSPNDAMKLYADLMEEAKIRISCIDIAISGKMFMAGQLVEEFCYLQLRMLCELIALGCLVAHGDIAAIGKLRKTWEADKIIKQLEDLHPEFYPYAVRLTIIPKSIHLDRKTEGFLTKEELITLWRKCADRLHRGTFKKLLSPKMPVQTHFSQVTTWTNKIVALLDQHHIMSPDGKSHFIVALKNRDYGDRVVVAFAKAPEQQ